MMLSIRKVSLCLYGVVLSESRIKDGEIGFVIIQEDKKDGEIGFIIIQEEKLEIQVREESY